MANAIVMNPQEMAALYEAMAGMSERMLAAASAGEWDRLVELEMQCAACIRQLKADGESQRLAGQERTRKIEAIRKMLAADRQIRDLAQPWMAKLSAMISNKGTERRIARAYGI